VQDLVEAAQPLDSGIGSLLVTRKLLDDPPDLLDAAGQRLELLTHGRQARLDFGEGVEVLLHAGVGRVQDRLPFLQPFVAGFDLLLEALEGPKLDLDLVEGVARRGDRRQLDVDRLGDADETAEVLVEAVDAALFREKVGELAGDVLDEAAGPFEVTVDLRQLLAGRSRAASSRLSSSTPFSRSGGSARPARRAASGPRTPFAAARSAPSAARPPRYSSSMRAISFCCAASTFSLMSAPALRKSLS